MEGAQGMTKVSGRALEQRGKARGTSLQALADQVQRLHQEAAAKDADFMALQKRLARVEANQKAQTTVSESRTHVYHVPQSLTELTPRERTPAGMTAMQSMMGQLDVKETTEELLAQLKALD